jgi:hypothetical protein
MKVISVVSSCYNEEENVEQAAESGLFYAIRDRYYRTLGRIADSEQ